MDQKTCVKIHKPPGGQSSFSISGGYENEAPKRIVRNPNQMSSDVSFNPQVITSIHQQPGGNSSLQLGGGNETSSITKPHTSIKISAQSQSHNNIFGEVMQTKQKSISRQYQQSNIFGEEDSQPKLNSKQRTNQCYNNPNESHNNIFGNSQETVPQRHKQENPLHQLYQQEQVKTLVKIQNPPGGRSSIQFG